MTAAELVAKLDGKIAAVRGEVAELQHSLAILEECRRMAMRRRVAEFEGGVVAQRLAVTGELVAWLEKQMGATWDGAPADDMAQAARKFLAEAKAKKG